MKPVALRRTLAGLALALAMASAAEAGPQVEGMDLNDGSIVEGHALVLNGAGSRKRGYSKVDVTALYLAQRQSSVEAVLNAGGAKRVVIRPLRDLPGGTVARYFVSDFTQAATTAEFKSLIPEVSAIGAVFGRVHQLRRGDIVTIDWVPEKGVAAAINGSPLAFDDAGTLYLRNELVYRIVLRMILNVTATEELRANLLGVSTSMQTANQR